jgi:acetylornithine/N-succinyldiaminopimelate aminotransferase
MTSDNSSTQGLVEAGRDNYMPNYAPKPIVLDHGKGARIWDLDGTEYIDLSTGIAVNAFGHQHPELLDAFMKQ